LLVSREAFSEIQPDFLLLFFYIVSSEVGEEAFVIQGASPDEVYKKLSSLAGLADWTFGGGSKNLAEATTDEPATATGSAYTLEHDSLLSGTMKACYEVLEEKPGEFLSFAVSVAYLADEVCEHTLPLESAMSIQSGVKRGTMNTPLRLLRCPPPPHLPPLPARPQTRSTSKRSRIIRCGASVLRFECIACFGWVSRSFGQQVLAKKMIVGHRVYTTTS
jgi:hypothetical protein